MWMRIGYADTKFSTTILMISISVMFFLAIWAFREMTNTEWQMVNFLSIYFIAAIIYTNIGVWLHEQLHCLAFWGTAPENRTHISFSRKYILFLNGHYRVKGAIDYRINRRALLAPVVLSVSLTVVGFLGNPVLPSWWLPILLTMAVAGLIDMTQDFYMYSQIRVIGEKGKYWDTGKYLEVVWKE
jgi:drug/metabolite transporter (DMT)-like permease